MKGCVEESKHTGGWMDGVIHTAVKGVDPGEPGQATSTEGLHPPFLSLSHSLLSDVFKRPSLSLSFLLNALTSFPFPYLCKTAFIFQEEALRIICKKKKKKKCQKTPQGPTGRRVSPMRSVTVSVCVCV